MSLKKLAMLSMILVVIAKNSFAQTNNESPMSFTLAEAQAYALENNDSIKLAKVDVSISKQQIKETTAMGLPQVNASLEGQYFFDIPTQLLPDFISPSVYGVLMSEGLIGQKEIPQGDMVAAQFGTNYNVTAGISANQLIFDGQYIVGLKASKAVKELSQSMLNTTTINTKATVTKLYLQSLVLGKTVNLLKLNLEALDNNIKEIKALVKEGFAEDLDVDRLQLAKQRIDNQIANSENNAKLFVLLLKIQMGYPIENPIVLTEDFDSFIETNENLLIAEANAQNRPEYRTLLVNKELQHLNAQRYKAGYLPNLVAFFSYSKNALTNEFGDITKGDNWFPTTVGGITLNVPIFDGLTKSAQIQQAKLDEEKVDIQIHQFEESVKLQVQQSQNNYSTALANYRLEKANYELTEKIYNRAQIKYKEGVGSSLEVSTALTDYYQAQTAYLNAQYQIINSKINLQKALGQYN